jgi:hypothetical protein
MMPTARSITFPRRMNCLNPFNMFFIVPELSFPVSIFALPVFP